jgi:hypothetical protein
MRTVIWSIGCLLLLAQVALAGSIGIYSSPDCGGGASTVAVGGSLTLYVMANTEPGEIWGSAIDKAEYRITGLPAGWSATAAPGPQVAVSIGDPFGEGVLLAFVDSYSGCLLLHTIVIQATTGVENDSLAIIRPVVPHAPFGQPLDCPWMHYPCGASCDSFGSCATPVAHVINPTVGVTPESWSAVRLLYR